MSKAVMISIQPKWVELILSGEKTIEVRKTRPSIETPFRVYIYCTKGYQANGKVIGEFTCDEIFRYARFGVVGEPLQYFQSVPLTFTAKEIDYKVLQLTSLELERYGAGKALYGWHISDLKIYDEPKNLSDFQMVNTYKGKWEKDGARSKKIARPPQSWCYVDELEEE